MTLARASGSQASRRPPAWLIACTGGLAVIILALAVAETNLTAHYLIDQGEYISVFGLVFISAASLYLYRSQRLFVSLPLVFPWVLYPVITQGDQVIDNLSINSMRVISHVLLAAIFATPVAVLVLAARYAVSPKDGGAAASSGWRALVPGLRQMSEGRAREGSAILAASLLVAETWLAARYLGTLMIVTIVIMTIAVLIYGSRSERRAPKDSAGRVGSERIALVVALTSVVVSAGAFVGYKNRPGAYQGSPSVFMDPSQHGTAYRLDRIALPSRPPSPPRDPASAAAALTAYGHTLDKLIAGYHILDRNYTYDFHNELFLRHTPLVGNYRTAGLALVEQARHLGAAADAKGAEARAALPNGDPLAALLDDLRDYVAFMLGRAPVLEQLSAGFEKTPAGLQHAAHLYEGEGKYLATTVSQLLDKHQAVLEAPAVAATTADFKATGRSIGELYANRIVGF